MKKLVICCMCCFAFGGAYAKSELSEVESFVQLQKLVEEIDNPTKTLVVMDNDATLTMMSCPHPSPQECQYLGGPAWYSWQSELLSNFQNQGQDSKFRVADSVSELIDISGLLLALNFMDYTEKDIPDVLQSLTKEGVRLLVETARGTDNIAATARQLKHLRVNGTLSILDVIQRSGLDFPEHDIAALPSPFIPCDIPGSRPVAYSQGIMYVAGQNKGVMLECLLTQYQKQSLSQGMGLSIDHIVFIDDTLENVENVHRTFVNNPHFNVYALHYMGTALHKSNLTEGKQAKSYQEKAFLRWQMIKQTLNQNLLKSTAPSKP